MLRGGAMARRNEDVAELFENIARLLTIKGDAGYRIRAYRDAAQSIAGLPEDVEQLMGNMGYSIAEARRGWAAPGNVLNAPSLSDLLAYLERRQRRASAA